VRSSPPDLLPPVGERLLADAVAATQLGHAGPGRVFLHDPDDLFRR
jgi:hypothetical protein